MTGASRSCSSTTSCSVSLPSPPRARRAPEHVVDDSSKRPGFDVDGGLANEIAWSVVLPRNAPLGAKQQPARI